MKKIISITLLLLFITSFAWAWLNFTSEGKRIRSAHSAKKISALTDDDHFKKLQLKAEEAKSFARKNNYNNQLCFLIDMSLPSGENRFFVYDLRKDTIRNAGLVTHGNCNQSWLEGRKYDNIQ